MLNLFIFVEYSILVWTCFCLVTQSCPTLWDPPPGSSVHGDSPGKKTRVGCHALLQGIFPTQGSHIAGGFFTIWDTRGSLRILELVAYPSLRELPDPGVGLGSPALRAVLYQLNYQGSPSSYLLKPITWSKSFKLGFSSMWTKNFQIYKLDLEEIEEPEVKWPTFVGS